MRSTTNRPGSDGSRNSARNTIEVGWTGPPTYTSSSPSTARSSCGTASPTVTSEGRVRTTPIAPSSLCTPINPPVRLKLGSYSAGEASRSWPASETSITPCSSSDDDQDDQKQAADGREHRDQREHSFI